LSGGWTGNNAVYQQYAFLYEKGSFTDLSNLNEVKSAGWTISTVSAINNSGQIVGYGLLNGQQRAFMLSNFAAPEIDAGNGMLALSVLGGLLALRKKKAGKDGPAASA
jgi:probable HAF family extracellular repeat protein